MYSDPESDFDADEFLLDNPRLYCGVQKCLNMVPTLPNEPNCNLVPLETLKLRLINDRAADNTSATGTKASAKTDEGKKVQDSFCDLTSDLQSFSQKLDSIFDCALSVLY